MKFTRWVVPALISGTLLMAACSGKHPGFKEENGMYYKIIPSEQTTSKAVADSGMIFSLQMSYGTPDTLLFDFSQTGGTPLQIPFSNPTYPGDINEAFAKLKAGDSAVFILNADSFFMNTARMPETPELFKDNNELYFYVKMMDILTPEQVEAKRQEELAAYKLKHQETLKNYMNSNYPEAEATASGLYVIVDKKGKGKLPKTGDYANVDLSVSKLTGEVLFDSRTVNAPQDIQIGKLYDTPGFTEALALMKKGEEANFIVPGSLAFAEQGRAGMLEPFENLKYWVRINNIKSQAQYEKEQEAKRKAEQIELEKRKQEEANTIANYIKNNNITAAPTVSGLYFIEKEAGTGKQAKVGSQVKVHYKGTLLDGTAFDSSYERNAPFEFTLGKGHVIPAWDEAIAMMKEGGKAELIIPSKIAYGARGAGALIKPFSPLKFEVELIEVSETK